MRAVVTVRDITAQREKEIEAERNRILLERTGIALIDYDMNTDTLDFQTMRKDAGFYKKSYPDYYNYVLHSELVHPDSADALRGVIESARNGADNGTVEYRADNWGTGYRWCRIYYSCLKNESGSVYRIVGQITDIQEEKDREELIVKLRGNFAATDFVNHYDAAIVTQVFRYLYNNESDTPTAVMRVLELLGEHFGVSRAYICEDDPTHQYSNNTFEWCAKGIEPQMQNLQGIYYETDAPSYKAMFVQTHTLFVPDVSAMPENERNLLVMQGIRAMLNCAIVDGDRYMGMIGFDDCTGSICWTEEIKGTLRLAAMMIGTFLLKYREHEGAAFSEDFMAALENNAEYIYIINPDTYEVIYCNRAIRELFGKDYVGRLCHKEFLESEAPCEVCPVAILRDTGKSGAVELLRPDGMWLLAQASPLYWKGHRVIMLTCADITKQKKAETELQRRNNEYAAIVRQSGKSIIRYNLHTGAAETFFDNNGFTGHGVFADFTEEMIRSGVVTPESADAYREFYKRIRAGEPSGSCDALVKRNGGVPRWNHADYTLVYDADGTPTHAIISYYDNDNEIRERQSLVAAAELDPLTGILNRFAAEKRICELLDAADGKRCAFIMLDLDNLKEINDAFGHAEGDRAIRLIAQTLSKHFRGHDVVSRVGGDEFMVLLTNISSAATLRGTMASFMRRLNENLIGEGNNYTPRCSVGVTFGVTGQDDFETLYRQADLALYHVKRNGKNDFAFYISDMERKDYTYAPHAGITLARTEWLEADEYKKLINALTAFFPLIISVNLTKNSYYMMEYASYATHKSRDAGIFDELIESGASTFHPEDKQDFIDCFNREALLRAYSNGKTSVTHEGRQKGDDGTYRWMKTTVVFLADEATGDICEITLAHPIDAEKQNETERLRLQKLLEFTVATNFEYICLLHTESGQYELYSNDGHNTHTVPKLGDFNEITTEIMAQHLAPGDRDEYYDNANITNVLKRMVETNGAYSYRYRLIDGEREAAFTWYEPTHTELLMTVRKV